MRDINFFSSYIDNKRISNKRKTYIISISILMVVILGGIFLFNLYKINNLEEKIMAQNLYLTNKEIINKTDEIKEKNRKIAIMNKYYEKAVEIQEILNERDKIHSNVIKSISKKCPKDVFIKNMTLTEKLILMEGIGKTPMDVGAFQHNLKNIDLFKDVIINRINVENEEGNSFNFTMKCIFKDVSENDVK